MAIAEVKKPTRYNISDYKRESSNSALNGLRNNKKTQHILSNGSLMAKNIITKYFNSIIMVLHYVYWKDTRRRSGIRYQINTKERFLFY